MADTGVFDNDKHLAWAWLCHWDLLVLDWAAHLLDDLSPLLLGNLWARHSEMSSWNWLCVPEGYVVD